MKSVAIPSPLCSLCLYTLSCVNKRKTLGQRATCSLAWNHNDFSTYLLEMLIHTVHSRHGGLSAQFQKRVLHPTALHPLLRTARLLRLLSLSQLDGTCVISRRFVSEEWHPHSEQLKCWIAASCSDTKANAAARTYIYNLAIANSLRTFDDIVDLSLSMNKIQYPLQGKVAEEIQAAISQISVNMQLTDIENMCQMVAVHPGAAYPVFLTVLSNSDVVARVNGLFTEINLDSLIRTCKSVWDASIGKSAEGLAPFFSCASHHLATKMKVSSDPASVAAQIICANAPLHLSSLRQVRAVFVELVIQLRSDQILTLTDTLARSGTTQERSVVSLLQTSFAKNPAPPSTQETAHFIATLTAMQLRLSAETLRLLESTIELCDVEVMLSLSASVHRQLILKSDDKTLAQIRNKILTRVYTELEKFSATTTSKLDLVACLSELDPLSAGTIFVDVLRSEANGITSVDAPRLLTIMKNAEVYPSEAMACIKAVPAETMDELMRVYALYTVVASGAEPSAKLLQLCLADRGLHRHGGRFKSIERAPFRRGDDRDTLLLLCLLGRQGEEAAYAMQLLLRKWRPTRVGVHILLKRVSKSKHLESAATHAIVVAATRYLGELCCDEIQTVFDLMAKADYRNAALFEQILERLAALKPPFSAVFIAARCAKTLRLSAVFERSAVMQCALSLTDVSDVNAVKLLKVCPPAQRKKFVQHRHIESLTTEAALRNLDTAELLTLFSVIPGKTVRRRILEEAKTRGAAGTTDLTAEDVLVAVEAANSSEQIRELFRIGGPSMQSVDEGQLSRLQLQLKVVEKCPNVCFRVIGRPLVRLADRLSTESALLWLSLYMRNNVRDDSVGKALIRKVNSRAGLLPRSAAKQLGEVTRFFGIEPSKVPTKRTKRMATGLVTGGDSVW